MSDIDRSRDPREQCEGSPQCARERGHSGFCESERRRAEICDAAERCALIETILLQEWVPEDALAGRRTQLERASLRALRGRLMRLLSNR